MDGIAIRGGSPAAVGGTTSWRLPAGSYAWIDTGDPLAADADTVIERERVVIGPDGGALVAGPVARGLNVRPSGEDFQAGEELIPAGHRLRPADLAAAAAAGLESLDVARQPVVAVIPTGDEIRPLGAALGPGEIIDSNSLMLSLRCAENGARAIVSQIQPDEPGAIVAELTRAAAGADLVLLIAGSSAGRGDHAASVLGRAGGVAVHGVAVRPGHPVLLGYAVPDGSTSRSAVPVIGVPGYPLAAAVIFEVFAVPLLATAQGAHARWHAGQRAELACDWTSSPDVEDWVPVTLSRSPAGSQPCCTVVATPNRRGAGSVSQLARADAWWPIPIGRGTYARGECVEVRPMHP